MYIGCNQLVVVCLTIMLTDSGTDCQYISGYSIPWSTMCSMSGWWRLCFMACDIYQM